MIAIKRKKSSGKIKISAAVVFLQVANTSDALIGKFLQVKKYNLTEEIHSITAGIRSREL